jgi:hypothetical protein
VLARLLPVSSFTRRGGMGGTGGTGGTRARGATDSGGRESEPDKAYQRKWLELPVRESEPSESKGVERL